MQKNTLIMFACALLFLFSCRKDSNETPSGSNDLITVTVSGIINVNGSDPLPNATVQIGNETRITDENGVFWFKDIKVPENRTYITVNNSGFFNGSRTIYPTEGSTSFVRINLIMKRIRGTVNAADGGTVEWTRKAKVIFPENAFVTTSGQVYNGEVQIVAISLNPDYGNIGNYMPGDLTAIDDSGEQVILATYGMMGVELIGENGEELQLASGKEAELHFSELEDLLSSAPATIPLWYFDEIEGIWREEGQAELVDNQYVGKVSHFSFWNCDAPFPLIMISGSFLSDSNVPISGARLVLTMQSTAQTGFDYTDSQGAFTGKIPANEILKLDFYNSCDELIFETTIGPFSSDQVLDPFVVNDLDFTVIGELKDCNGANVQNGYVKVNVGLNGFLIPVENGKFEGHFLNCENETITISACDIGNEKLSPAVTYNSEPIIDVGVLTACEEDLDGYISWTYNNFYYLVQHPQGFEFSSTGRTYLKGFEADNIAFIIKGMEVGEFDIDTDSEFIEGIDPASTFTEIKATITNYEGVGGFVQGTFSGILASNQIVEGAFKVKLSAESTCEINAPFTGQYLVEQISGDGGFGMICGPEIVEVFTIGIADRGFEAEYLPGTGGFDTPFFTFSLDCGNVEFPLWDSGLGCGGSSITIIGDNPPALYDSEDDSEIIIKVIDYYTDGGCGVDQIPSVLRLTKQ